MGRERVKMKLKLKRRPKELPRKARVLCDFCGVSTTRSYTNKGHTNKNMKHWLRERQEKPIGLSPLLEMKREFERRISESLESEFERLWLFNERMNGRELEGMTYSELARLHIHISRALIALIDQRFGPREEQIARQPEEGAMNNDKGADTSLQFRLLLVSRKLRRIHNCYNRKSMPETK